VSRHRPAGDGEKGSPRRGASGEALEKGVAAVEATAAFFED
jgi:hypothetical protein